MYRNEQACAKVVVMKCILLGRTCMFIFAIKAMLCAPN